METGVSLARASHSEPLVKDIMTDNVYTLFANDTLEFLEDSMKWKRIRHVPVISKTNDLIGIISHRDFLRVAISELANLGYEERKELYKKLLAKNIMSGEVISVSPDTTLFEAARLMNKKKIGCLPVCLYGKLVGIVTEADFVKTYIHWAPSFDS